MENNILDAVKIEDLSSVKKKLSFEIPWEKVKKEMDQVYSLVSRNAKIKGFRPGKIPRKILELYYKEYAEGETVTNLVNHFYWDAIEKNSIRGVSKPEIDQGRIELEKAFSFSATVEIEPIVEPKDYKGMMLTNEIEAVTEKQVDERLEALRHIYATLEDVSTNREVQNGDFVTIDFQGEVDGNALSELKAEGHFLEIGSKKMVQGFEEQIVGMKVNETKEISVAFPDDYPFSPVAGKAAIFLVKLSGIKEKKLPPLDETFIQNLEKYESLDVLKADIRRSLEEGSMHRANTGLRRKMMDILLEKNIVEVPPSIVERQLQYLIMDFQRRAYQSGMQVNQSPEMISSLKEQFLEEARRQVKIFLLMKNIALKEGITVSDGEIDQRIVELSERYAQTPESLKKHLEKDGTLDHIHYDLLDAKVFDFLTSHAQINEVITQVSPLEKEEKSI